MALIRLSDSEWQKIEPLLTPPPQPAGKPGRPHCDIRSISEAILWVLKTGARWRDLPPDYGVSYQSAHRYHQHWGESGVYRRINEILGEQLAKEGVIDLSECYIDGTFAPARKGGTLWGPPSAAKAQKSWR